MASVRLGSSGGGAHVDKFTLGPNSSAMFRRCKTEICGGGLRAEVYQQDAGSSVLFQNCSADDTAGYGGGASVYGNFMQGPHSSAIFRSCSAGFQGGGLRAEVYQQDAGSSVLFQNCSAENYGGGAHVSGFTQGPHSSAIFRSCSAGNNGGGLHVTGSYQQDVGSSILFQNCSAERDGGGASVKTFAQGPNSSAIFRSCRAAQCGGGLHANGGYQQEAGSLVLFEHCSAEGGGGGACVKASKQGPNSSAIFRSCSAAEFGGGLYVKGSYQQEAGSSALFQNCSADWEGGGAYTRSLDGNGSMHFQTCRAYAGGGLRIPLLRTMRHGGSLAFEACSASSIGGGLYSSADQGRFAKLRLDRCDADVAAAAFAAIAGDSTEAEVRIEELSLLSGSSSHVSDFAISGELKLRAVDLHTVHQHTESSFGIYIAAHDLVFEHEIDCTKTATCTFLANASQSAGFQCPLGTGVVDFRNSEEFGCLACKPGDTQIWNMTNRSCSRCPDGALTCLAGEMKMERGLMVELQDNLANLSRSFHCPNEAACPGGNVFQGRIETAMCQEGYRGPGCTSCSNSHAMADSSVLACTACSDDRGMQVMQWIAFLSQRAFLFGLAAMSVLRATRAGELAHSGIYLNQLMAFSTICNTILEAVLNTKTAKDMKSEAVNFFFDATVTMAETGSGQGSPLNTSSQCLLSYVGLGKTLLGAHLLDVVVAVVLVALLSLRDSRAALVAGLNCFQPTIVADFGKYMVCYRVLRDGGSGLQGRLFPFLPGDSGLTGVLQVGGGLLLFMTACVCTWLNLSRSAEEPLPSHVVFLTSKYRPEFSLFETERLVRKTLFTFIGALLPIASSPALRMGGLGIVVLTSLSLYHHYHPYQMSEWNRMEINLLSTAMFMIIGVSTLLANELHWGHSVQTQRLIIVATAVIAAGASAFMSFRVIQELVRERRPSSK
ncbi:pmpB [Symbiodinium sp. CCMP2592]|nr:pmpB [Symbiodinium sp. CCMP2592]